MRKSRYRQDFEEKVENIRYRTAELKNGYGFIEIYYSTIKEGRAVFFGRHNGVVHHFDEAELRNFCL